LAKKWVESRPGIKNEKKIECRRKSGRGSRESRHKKKPNKRGGEEINSKENPRRGTKCHNGSRRGEAGFPGKGVHRNFQGGRNFLPSEAETIKKEYGGRLQGES